MLKLDSKCQNQTILNSFLYPLLKPASIHHSPPPLDATTIANLIVKTTNDKTLTKTLQSIKKWSPELVNAIFKRLWNHGPKALQFFHLLDLHPSYTHSSDSFDYAIDISARMRDYKTLWSLVARMRMRKLGPGPKTFAIITERFVCAGKSDRAVKVFLSMHEYGCRQDLIVFNTFLDVLCKSRKAEMAYKLFGMLRGRFRCDTITYNIIVNGFCLINKTNKALEILKEMVDRGLEPSLSSYNTMLKGFFRVGQLKEAWEFFLQMKRRKVEIDVVTYTTVVHGFGVGGEVVRARKVFDEMTGAGVLPSVVTYNALIQVLCKKDNVENAIVLFEEMLKKGYVPNVTTYNVIIRGLCHVEKMDEAVGYMDRMKKDECEPNIHTYNVVIRYYCDSGEVEKGLEIFERMGGGSCLPNLDTYNVLISAMFVTKKSDDLLLAGRLLIEMVDRGFLPRRFTYNRVLNGLLLTGNQEFAREILRRQSKYGRIPIHFKM
ncbi:hypothetical protein Leryth_019644 [Lithospermum erythrorhizon]|nr:hypothetical protein Leryth_019644 [Lithospermum erythrorhizon]